MTVRLPDWRARLTQYVAAHARRAYRPGEHDCVLFAAGGVEALTGHDPMAVFRGRYRTIEEGIELVLGAGFSEHFGPVTDGLPEIAPAYAAVGDIALLDGADGIDAMGIVQGEMVYVLHPRGSAVLPMTSVRRAWRV